MIQQFQVNDWVTCLPGFTNGYSGDPKYAGRGYVDGLTFKIDTERRRYKTVYRYIACYYPKDGNGVYPIALRLATDEEIALAKTKKTHTNVEENSYNNLYKLLTNDFRWGNCYTHTDDEQVAIDFATWVALKGYTLCSEGWMDDTYTKTLTDKELFQIFKSEKNVKSNNINISDE